MDWVDREEFSLNIIYICHVYIYASYIYCIYHIYILYSHTHIYIYILNVLTTQELNKIMTGEIDSNEQNLKNSHINKYHLNITY